MGKSHTIELDLSQTLEIIVAAIYAKSSFVVKELTGCLEMKPAVLASGTLAALLHEFRYYMQPPTDIKGFMPTQS